ncbi:MAG: hypothetical protein RBS43_09315 [Candidatus Cloacimonas sp.]|jgi:hypothetical protein|nr:hypothetical protein [Candidatus Cloacimonas sp.]
MRFLVSGMLLIAILVCGGCASAKGEVSVPIIEQRILPEIIIPEAVTVHKRLVLPSRQDAMQQLIGELLDSLLSGKTLDEGQHPPVLLIGMPEGLKDSAEASAVMISELLLKSASVYLSAPLAEGKRPSLPESQEAAKELAQQSGAEYFLYTSILETSVFATVTLVLIELGSLNTVWTKSLNYKIDIDKELN